MSSMPGIETLAPERTETKRVVGLSELRPACSSRRFERLIHLSVQALGLLPTRVHVGDAGLGSHSESGRDAVRTEHARHLGQVGALAAE